MLYTLNLESDVCQFFLNKTENKKKPKMSGQLLDTQRRRSLGDDLPFEAYDGSFCSIPSSIYLLEPQALKSKM